MGAKSSLIKLKTSLNKTDSTLLLLFEPERGGFVVSDLNPHTQERVGEGLALRIRHQGKRAAAAQAFMQQEVERAQVRQLKTLYLALADARDMLLDACGRDF